MRQSRSSEGVHVREMRATFPELTEDKLRYIHRNQMNAYFVSQIIINVFLCSFKSDREVLDFLSTEGHIYSTIDDEHYKTTDSMWTIK